MSASQFDDLLGDLGDSTSTTTKQTSNGNMDDFDPFGPSAAEQSANYGDSGLLLDFTLDTEVRNIESSNGVDFEYHGTSFESGSANPDHIMSTGAQSSNPLYDLSSSNPLYDLSMDDGNQSANPLYDLGSSDDVAQPSNLLYEFEDSGSTQEVISHNQMQYSGDQGDLLGNFEDHDDSVLLHQDHGVREEFSIITQDDVNNSGENGEQLQQEEDVTAEQELSQQQYRYQVEQLSEQADEEPSQLSEQQVEEYNEQAIQEDEEYRQDDAQQQNDYREDVVQQQEEYREGVEKQAYNEEAVQQQLMSSEQFLQEEYRDDNEEQRENLKETHRDQATIPSVEITQSPDTEEVQSCDLIEEHHSVVDDVDYYVASGADASVGHHDKLTPPENYGHDRREEDLENYCMDREESDLMEEQDSPEAHGSTLKAREERSRSPSRSIGPDTQDESDVSEEVRDRGDRSHAPSRSLEPELRPGEVGTHHATTFRSFGSITLSLAPSPLSCSTASNQDEEVIQDGRTVSKTTHTENRYTDSGLTQPSPQCEGLKGIVVSLYMCYTTSSTSSTDKPKLVSSSYLSQNDSYKEKQTSDHDGVQDSQNEQDIVHFTELSTVKNKFESQAPPPERKQVDIRQEVMSSEGGVYESQPQNFQQWQNEEEEEEGVYENTPVRRQDVAREADKDPNADLPAVGTASSIRAKLLSGASQDNTPRKREITPPAHGAGGEYVSEPRGYIEKYEGRADAGVFESQPLVNPDVVTSTTQLEDVKPEHGFAKNVAAKFKELESKSGSYTPSGKRELTPDRSGRVEYVSEPRGHIERYEGKSDSGVFESQPAVNPDVVRSGEELREELPEKGTARSMAQKFRQISSESTTTSSRTKRELTPDKSGRVEYVSEPRSQMEAYEVKVDAGVFENQPQRNLDVVNSETSAEEFLPERGYAKNVAAKFKVLESSAKSPPLSPGRRKEFTPPREEERAKQAVVLENTPDFRSEIIHSGDQLEEKLPERGTAKSMAQRFKQMEQEKKNPSAPRQKKEFTPPPHDSGVYENQPKQFQADYNRPAESGILENTPVVRDDIIKATDYTRSEEELPERGTAKNMVNKWRQLETVGVAKAKSPGSSGRPKEFTPPREEPRIAQQRNPKSPRTPLSPSGYDQLDNGSVHPRDLPGQYQPLNEPTIFESTPAVRSDLVKEADTDWTEGMPKKDTAKKMLAKFQHIQEEAKKQTPLPVTRKEEAEVEVRRKTPRKDSTYSEGSDTDSEPYIMENENTNSDSGGDKVGRSKSMRAAIQTEKCGACDKTVYAMERLEMNKRVYHKACFRCTQCKAVLTPKTFAINNEVIFCTNHYKQLFATKGNYDEGFGRMQHKKRWSSNPNLHERDGEENGKHTTKS